MRLPIAALVLGVWGAVHPSLGTAQEATEPARTWTDHLAVLDVDVPTEIGFDEDGLPWVIGSRGVAQATSSGRWQRRQPPDCPEGQQLAVYGDAGGLRFLCYEAAWDRLTWASYRSAPDGTLHALVRPDVPEGDIPRILYGVIEGGGFEERETVVEADTQVHLFERDDAGRLHVVTDGLYARLEDGAWMREALPLDDANRAALDPTTGVVAVFTPSSPSGAVAYRREASWERLPLFGFPVLGVTGFVLLPTTGQVALAYVAGNGTDSLAVEEGSTWTVMAEPGACEDGDGIAVADRDGELHYAERCRGGAGTVQYNGPAAVNGIIDSEDVYGTLYADLAVHDDGRVEVVHVYGSDRDMDRTAGLHIGGALPGGGWWEETLLRGRHLRGARMVAAPDGTRHLVYWLDSPRVEGTRFHYAMLAPDGTFTASPLHTAPDQGTGPYVALDRYTEIAPTLAEILWDGERAHICYISPVNRGGLGVSDIYCATAPDAPETEWTARLVGSDSDEIMLSSVQRSASGEPIVLADEHDGTLLFEPNGEGWTRWDIEFPDRAALPASMAVDDAGVTVICSTELADTMEYPSPGGPTYCGDHMDGTLSLHPMEPGGVSRSRVFLERDDADGQVYRLQQAPGGLGLGTLTDSGWDLAMVEYPVRSDRLHAARFLLGFELIDRDHLAVLYVDADYQFRLFTSEPYAPDVPGGADGGLPGPGGDGGPDGGDGPGGSTPPSDPGGCSCSTEAGSGGPVGILFCLALLALGRRRPLASSDRSGRILGCTVAVGLAVAVAVLVGCGPGSNGTADAGGPVPGVDGGDVADGDGGGTGSPRCTFQSARTSLTRWKDLQHIAARSLDGDEDLELVASWREGLVIFDNDGEGAMTESSLVAGPEGVPIELMMVEDLDGDGNFDVLGLSLDIVEDVLHRVVWRGRGDGTFEDFSASQGPFGDAYNPREPVQAVLADIVGDGLPDLVLVIEEEGISEHAVVTENRGAAPFFGGRDMAVPGGYERARVCFHHADVDADGHPDVLLTAWGGHTSEADADAPLLYVALSSTPDESPHVPDSPRAYHMMTEEQLMRATMSRDYSGGACPIVGDLDLDGDLDVLVGTNALLNDGGGRFGKVMEEGAAAVPVMYEARWSERLLEGGDLDGDGALDLVSQPTGPGLPPRVSFGRDGLAFSGWTLGGWAGHTEIIALDTGDMNGDGLTDLISLERVPAEAVEFPPLGAQIRVWSCADTAAGAPEVPPNLSGRVLESTSLSALYFGTSTRTFGVAEGAYARQYDFTYEVIDDSHATLTLTNGDGTWELALSWSSATAGTYRFETDQEDYTPTEFGYQFVLRDANLAEDP